MSNDLWFHALKVLNGFRSTSEAKDVYKLYEFQDDTGILHRHKEAVEAMYSREERLDIKTVYFELIKMMLDEDRHKSPEGHKQTREVDKIQGFQVTSTNLEKMLIITIAV